MRSSWEGYSRQGNSKCEVFFSEERDFDTKNREFQVLEQECQQLGRKAQDP